jgi:hypothetical protein
MRGARDRERGQEQDAGEMDETWNNLPTYSWKEEKYW